MTSLPLPSKCADWMTSECKKRLCGMTTAPSTLTTMAAEPLGRLGVTQDMVALGQSTSTRASSARNERPTMLTKAMIKRSERL